MCRHNALIALLCALLFIPSVWMSACGRADDEARLFVAASLADVAHDWQTGYAQAGGRLSFHSGGSAILAQQIIHGADADLLLSAGPSPALRLQADGLLARIDTSFLSNRMVIVCRNGIEPPQSVHDITQPRFARIAIADPASAPAGEYARAGLTAAGLWTQLRDRIISTADVRAALMAVSTGAADAAFVYATDAATEPDLRSVDPGFPATRYVLAMTKPETPVKVACWEYLHGDAAMRIASARGFRP